MATVYEEYPSLQPRPVPNPYTPESGTPGWGYGMIMAGVVLILIFVILQYIKVKNVTTTGGLLFGRKPGNLTGKGNTLLGKASTVVR